MRLALSSILLPAAALHGQCTTMAPMQPVSLSFTYAPENRSLPTIFIVGDSTGAGWGPQFAPFFDAKKVNVVVAAASGRSARTYLTEGLWDRVMKQMRTGDIVLLQFGHNDASALNDPCRARGDIRSVGDESQEIDNQMTHQHETIHSFGWYMRKFIEDTKAKGATPVVMSMTPDNVWNGDKMEHDKIGYPGWSAQVAEQEHVGYVDINAFMSDRFTKLGEVKTTELYAPKDKTHFGKVGWQLVALWTLQALEGLADKPVDRFLTAQAKKDLSPAGAK